MYSPGPELPAPQGRAVPEHGAKDGSTATRPSQPSTPPSPQGDAPNDAAAGSAPGTGSRSGPPAAMVGSPGYVARPSPAPAFPPASAEVKLPPGTTLHVHNAGLVLLHPFFPRLFQRFELLDAELQFRDPASAQRAVLLLEYLASRQSDLPEYMLALNKLLCGLPLTFPVPRGLELGDDERETLESLLDAVLEQWGALGQTSADGLRGSFLLRPGALQQKDAWKLVVERKAYDLLLGKLPWSYSVVRHRWMEGPLFVEWGGG